MNLAALELYFAKVKFKSLRADLYMDMAQSMKAAPGVSIATLLEKYAYRYKKEPIGVIATHWVSRMQNMGTFTEAIRGTVPDHDLTIIHAAETNGDLIVGLSQLGTNLLSMKKVAGDSWKTLSIAVVMVIFLHAYLAIQAFSVMPQLERVMNGMVKISTMDFSARIFFDSAALIRDWWWLWLLMVGSFIWLVIWSLSNYTGRLRHFLDRNIFIYQMYRDFIGASFIMSAASLSRNVGTKSIGFYDAISAIKEKSSTPWMIWQIDQIQHNIRVNPNSKAEIFNTGITSKKMYYRLQDVADYLEMAPMLEKVGELILEIVPAESQKRANVIRYVVVMLCISAMVGGFLGTMNITKVFKQRIQIQQMR